MPRLPWLLPEVTALFCPEALSSTDLVPGRRGVVEPDRYLPTSVPWLPCLWTTCEATEGYGVFSSVFM